MNLNKLYAVNNDCYKSNKYIKVKGIMVHSTGANNPNLKRYVGPDDGKLGYNKNNNHWNMPGVGSCVHAFIGKLANGSIATYQTLPWDMRGWHAGGRANDTHIGFEICEDNLSDSKYFNLVYKEAIELCAYLCEMFNLDPLADGVLICHSEGNKRGIASNHSDVMHWFPRHGKSMDTFRKEVSELLTKKQVIKEDEEINLYSVGDIVDFIGDTHYTSSNSIKGSKAASSKAKITNISNKGKHPYHIRAVNNKGEYISGVYGWVDTSSITKNTEFPYRVKVTADVLRYRSGPGLDYIILGRIRDKGVYTIIDEKNGWGQLKSKVGWISLEYTERV